MVKINPNLTTLTKPINKHLNQLTIIKLNHNLTTHLQTHPFLNPKLTIYQQNTITFNFNKLTKKINQPLHIFNNLPYNISTPLMFHLFNYTNTITNIHFILQKKIINHLITKPNNKTYNQLNIITQYYYNIIPILKIPPSTFTPPPKVNSTIIHLVPHTTIPHPIKNIHILNHITTKTFNQHHKTIHNNLNNLFNIKILTKIKINPTIQTKNISITQYYQITNYLTKNTPLQKN